MGPCTVQVGAWTDLGPPVTHVEQNFGIPLPPPQNFGLRPNPEEDANRAERMRLARQAQEALESKVFFAVSLRQGQAGEASVDTGSGAVGTVAACKGLARRSVMLRALWIWQRWIGVLRPKVLRIALPTSHRDRNREAKRHRRVHLSRLELRYQIAAGAHVPVLLLCSLDRPCRSPLCNLCSKSAVNRTWVSSSRDTRFRRR